MAALRRRKADPGGTQIPVKVLPRSSADRVTGVVGGRIKVCVTAAPEKGKANERLLRTLSRFFGIPFSRVSLLSGDSSREKCVLLAGVTAEEVKEKIDDLA